MSLLQSPGLRSFGRFVNNMDARAVTSALVMLGLLAFIAVGLVFGEGLLGADQDAVRGWMGRAADSPFALAGVVLVYCVLALIGFPQTILIAGTVAVFGVARGIPYSWVATMTSATLTFGMGRVFGGRFVRRVSAGRAASMIEVMRRRGVWASMIVRVTPSAPFIVVNAICGAAHVPAWKFWLGTGLGILPKILFLSLFTGQVDELMAFFGSRDPADLLVIVLLVVGWLAFLVLTRWLYMRTRSALASAPDEG